MAPQFTATNAPVARGERRWISRATTSLPAPVSPGEDRDVGRRDLLDAAVHLAHRRPRADEIAVLLRLNRLLERDVLATEESRSIAFWTSSDACAVKTVSASSARSSNSETTLSLPR